MRHHDMQSDKPPALRREITVYIESRLSVDRPSLNPAATHLTLGGCSHTVLIFVCMFLPPLQHERPHQRCSICHRMANTPFHQTTLHLLSARPYTRQRFIRRRIRFNANSTSQLPQLLSYDQHVAAFPDDSSLADMFISIRTAHRFSR